MIFCIIFCILYTSTPVSGSVQDNLQSAIAKILGQKNETTNAANFNNASTNAKLNYLNSKIDNLETRIEISGGTPKCVESGSLASNETKTFTGPGELYLSRYFDDNHYFVVDGLNVDKYVYQVSTGNWPAYRIPFHDQCTIGIGTYNSVYDYLKYSYYKY